MPEFAATNEQPSFLLMEVLPPFVELQWCKFLFNFSALFFLPAAQENIGAETGQDVILPCQTPDNNPVIVVEWRRNDSVSEYVLLFRDDQLDPDNQQPTFRNRVDLLFRPIKDRNASLVLKNVTTDDKGTYECRVIERDPKRGQRAGLTSEPVSIVNLDVVPPGQKDDQEENHVSHRRRDALIGVAVLLAAAAAAVSWRKIKMELSAEEHQMKELP
ncbi:PREDICTED: uncharacterized protein LOC106916692 isoform X1 [Poecilia mexicana]|uniref:uncharacterized protein LOC106916691 n=1 Tax=Poecilia mexicana TaxID=48701 RepID=UPI00072DA118|nr:PREDICTED: uncharacterized protein LOC106916691 [Poecilia mexicana]XP_014840639.1 PREDICTED: uncharacterized protein LOC106916692 isoform X1 [Poecilia mexicana]